MVSKGFVFAVGVALGAIVDVVKELRRDVAWVFRGVSRAFSTAAEWR